MANEPKKVELTIAGLQADLKAGLNRKAQAEKYGVPLAAINRAYKNEPSLKGKRVFSPRGSSATEIVFTDKAEFSATEQNAEIATAVEAGESSTEATQAEGQTETATTTSATPQW